MIIRKPIPKDFDAIYHILNEWLEQPYLDELFQLIKEENIQHLDYNRQHFVLEENNIVIGIGGIADLIPDMKSYAKSDKPGSIKSLYIADKYRGKGYGKKLLLSLEQILKSEGYTEIILRSAEKFQSTAWDFYIKMGYNKLGVMTIHDDKTIMAVFSKLI